MKRLRKLAFNSLAVVSLLLCVASIGLWVRSYRHSDYVCILIGKAVPVQFSTTSQAEAWDRSRKANGWYAMFTVNYLSGASWRGKCHIISNRDREIALSPHWKPKLLAYSSDAKRVLFLDGNPLAGSGIGDSSEWRHWGLEYDVIGFGAIKIRRYALPWWMVTIVMLILPMRFVGKTYATRRRRIAGLCPTCGYDLRATPDCCPECGTIPRLASA